MEFFKNIFKSQEGLLEYRANRPKIEKIKSVIRIIGLDSYQLLKYFNKTIDSTRLSNNMFNAKNYVLEFEEFFIPDVFLLLNKTGINKAVPISYRKQILNLATLLKNNTYLKDTENKFPNKLNLNKLNDFNLTPMLYQKEFLESYSDITSRLRLNGILLSAAPGTGKTFTSLAWAHCLEATRIIIICPLNAVKTPWEEAIIGNDELNKAACFKNKQTYWLSTTRDLINEQRILICHYERLEQLVEISNRLKLTKKLVIILDESHNMNESNSNRTELFIKLCKDTEASEILLMSGTPVKALGSELNTLFTAIDKTYNKTAAERFRKIYTSNSKGALVLLADRFSKISFKVEKSELKLDKPNIITIKVKLENGDRYTIESIKKDMRSFVEERIKYYNSIKDKTDSFYKYCIEKYKQTIKNDMKAYRELEIYNNYITVIKDTTGFQLNLIKDELKYCNNFEKNKIPTALTRDEANEFKNAKSLYKYPLLKIQGECLGRVLGKLREECFTDIARAINYENIISVSEKKVLIFASYVNSCQAAYDKIVDLHYTPLKVYGDSTKDLSKTVNIYNSIPEMNPLVTTFDSLSTAVPLTVANTIIMINMPFRDYEYQQAIARVWRKGADCPVFINECELDTGNEPNISTRSIDILKITSEIAESITGMKSGLSKDTNYNDVNNKLSLESYDIDIPLIKKELSKNILKW